MKVVNSAFGSEHTYEREYEFSALSTRITGLELAVFPSADGLIGPFGDPVPLQTRSVITERNNG